MRRGDLAWGFVHWALAQGDATLHTRVQEAFAKARPRPGAAAIDRSAEPDLSRHGHLGAAAAAELRDRLWDDLIAPAAAAMWPGRLDVGDARVRGSTTLDGATPLHESWRPTAPSWT